MNINATNRLKIWLAGALMVCFLSVNVSAQSAVDNTVYTFEDGLEGWEADNFGTAYGLSTMDAWAGSGSTALTYMVDFDADTQGAVRKWELMDMTAYDKIGATIGHSATENDIYAGIYVTEGENYVLGSLVLLNDTSETYVSFDLNSLIRDGGGDITQIYQIGILIKSTNETDTITVYVDDVSLMGDPEMPLSFEGIGPKHIPFNDFGGHSTILGSDPTDETNTVAMSTKNFDAEDWAGVAIALGEVVPFNEDSTKLSIRVYSPLADIPITLKAEKDPNPDIGDEEVESRITTANAWETIVFDFKDKFQGNYDRNYGTVTVFFNFYGGDIGTQTFLWDDLNILSSSATSVEEPGGNIPEEFSLSQNYPNPFNPSTVISYNVAKSAHVNISVYNMLGQKVATLVNETQNAGSKQVRFDAQNFTSGVYIYRIEAGSFVDSKRMVLIK